MSQTLVLVAYRAQPGQVETARSEITALVQAVLAAEPECGGIQIVQDTADPSLFTLLERWPSAEVFLGPHMQQPHIQAFIRKAGAFLAGPPDISFWRQSPAPMPG
ncbi:putative quinol monooxygenase [Arenimonas caeni]|jgi:quinol monooxygenase YgiN|uniref:Antibiotic biosynthesis monooxygenase n=1 Tax=Arenimonas caeni TaxID=2058085 RepID=A0A2P6M9W2_9GAMM|nr:putative quinol monooxygenase [Arenimonas caeni]MDY0023032.1 putative quinol monooxygenase [Arenimonas caeni]PRH82763.1 antibiotic biosynthesis monooxygenase [Arenimonas caeni]